MFKFSSLDLEIRFFVLNQNFLNIVCSEFCKNLVQKNLLKTKFFQKTWFLNCEQYLVM